MLEASDKKVKVLCKGIGERLYSITEGELKEDFPSLPRYKFLDYLKESEKLDFEVANYIADISGIELDYKTINECKYMQKSANFEIEQYNINKSIAQYLFTVFAGINIVTNIQPAWIIAWLPSWLLSLFARAVALFIIFIPYIIYYQHYYEPRRRFKELTLRLESSILFRI